MYMSNQSNTRRFLNILIITGQFPARSETFVKEHTLGLARLGHRVTVISCGPERQICPSEIEEINVASVERIEISHLGTNSLRNLFHLLTAAVLKPKMVKYWFPFSPWCRGEMYKADNIWRELRRINPDIIHIHSGMNAGALVRQEMLSQAVVSWHGYDANCVPKRRGEHIYENLFRSPVHHTVGSGFMLQRLEKLGACRQKVSLIPMGIDTDFFAYKKRASSPLLPLRLVSVGRLDEMKGHTFLIQAVSELLSEGIKLELHIIGEGSLRRTLNTKIGGALDPSAIRLLGAKAKEGVRAELWAADIFCLTGTVASSGRVETQGVVFAEAQATGLPVIGSSVGGVSDSLVDGVTGILCPPGDIPAIKKAIRFFAQNREAINEFGRRGRTLVEMQFSLKGMIESFERLYQEVLTET